MLSTSQPNPNDTQNSLLPCAESLLRVHDLLKPRLEKSLRHLLLETGQSADRAALYAKCLDHVFQDKRLPGPVLFAVHKMLVDAALADDVAAFENAATALVTLPDDTFQRDGMRIHPFASKHSADAAIAALAYVFQDDVGLTVDLVSPPANEIARMEPLLREAFGIMNTYATEWDDEFRLLVCDIYLAANQDSSKNGFGGASVFDAYGSILVNPASHTQISTTFMTLIHESSHARLFLYHLEDPILLNEETEVYASPLRKSLRPMEGIFHGAWVSARMAIAASHTLDAGFSGPEAKHLHQQMQQAKRVFEDCQKPIDANAKFSDLGERLYQDAVAELRNA